MADSRLLRRARPELVISPAWLESLCQLSMLCACPFLQPAGTKLFRLTAAQGATRFQPAGRVGPNAPLTKALLLRYQIAV